MISATSISPAAPHVHVIWSSSALRYAPGCKRSFSSSMRLWLFTALRTTSSAIGGPQQDVDLAGGGVAGVGDDLAVVVDRLQVEVAGAGHRAVAVQETADRASARRRTADDVALAVRRLTPRAACWSNPVAYGPCGSYSGLPSSAAPEETSKKRWAARRPCLCLFPGRSGETGQAFPAPRALVFLHGLSWPAAISPGAARLSQRSMTCTGAAPFG
jgi:hypothetical protein